jgi:hypothetical protein
MKEFQQYMYRSQRTRHWTVLDVDGKALLSNASETEAWECFLFTHNAAQLFHWHTLLATHSCLHTRRIDGALAPSSPKIG